MKDTKKIPKTNSLAEFYSASLEDICLWIICYTDGNDVEHLKKQDRYTLIEYALHVHRFLYDIGLTPMPYISWYWSNQSDIKIYQAEQEAKQDLLIQ